jgi:hypothetical protein
MSQDVIETRAAAVLPIACKGLPLSSRPYQGSMPPALAPWHVYVADGGHSIIAILQQHEYDAFVDDPAKMLMPIPVKSVLRGYEVYDGYIIASSPDLEYSSLFGLICPPEDTEL